MSPLRAAHHGLRALFRRAVVDREIDDEINHYIEQAIEDNLRAGMTREAAERAARVAFGGVDAAKEGLRAGGWENAVDTSWRDIRFAFRGLRRNPGFTTIVIATLALGIGANTAMFSVVNAVMLRPLPYHDPDRMAMIWTDDVRRGLHREATATRTIAEWQREAPSFEQIAYFNTARQPLRTNDPFNSREQTRRALVSTNLFRVLGVSPARGRTISEEDERQRAPVAVISHSLWLRHFGAAEDVVGKILQTDAEARDASTSLTIIGVMPPDFYFPDKQTEIWMPATTYWRFSRESTEWFPGWARRWTAVGRLAPGRSLADARTDLAHIAGQLTAAHVPTVPDFPGFNTTVVPILDVIAGEGLQATLWLLLGAVALVQLVACANVANLLLARTATRHRELAIRRALGAGRARLIRAALAEHAVLAIVGGSAGTLLAAWGTHGLASAAAAFVPRIDEVTIDARVLAFAAASSIAAGLIYGLPQAFRMSKTNAGDALKDTSQGAGVRLGKSRAALVVIECAVAVVLLTGAGLLLKSLVRVMSVDPGFDARPALVARIVLPPEPPASKQEQTQTSTLAQSRARAREALVNDLIDRITALPNVEASGFIDDLFASGAANSTITIPGRPDEAMATPMNDGSVSAGFFSSMRVPLTRGRYLTRDDAFQKIRALWSPVITDQSLAEKERRAVPEPVVVNEAFVRRFFPDEDPIGRKFCIDPTNKTYWYEIVGVIGNMHRQGLERAAVPEYFGPYLPSPNGRVDLLIRVTGDPLAIASTIRPAVASTIPGASVQSVATVESALGNFSALRRLQTWLLTGFAALALLLAALGIYGVVRYSVAERTQEIGVRVALGASPPSVLALIIRQGIVTPAIGLAIGLGLSAALTRVVEHLLFGVGTLDPAIFVGVALLLGLVAALACYVPARRAARLDPVRALRLE